MSERDVAPTAARSVECDLVDPLQFDEEVVVAVGQGWEAEGFSETLKPPSV
jgi:hypothetical protein